MVNRTPRLALAGAGLLVAASLATAGVAAAASADDVDTGPRTAACIGATAEVRAAAIRYGTAADDITAVNMAVLQAKAKLQAATDAAVAAADAYRSDPTPANQTVLAKVVSDVSAAASVFLNTAGPTDAQKAAVVNAEASLKAAVAARVKACTDEVAPSPSPSTTPTTSAAATTSAVPTPATTDDDSDTVTVLPNAIDTGRG